MKFDQAIEEGRKYLREYAGEVLKPSKYGAFQCPFCGSGTGPHGTGAFNIDKSGDHFKCFACGESGSIFDLVMKIRGGDFPVAVRWVAGKYRISIDEDESWKERKHVNRNDFLDWDSIIEVDEDPRGQRIQPDLSSRKTDQAAAKTEKKPAPQKERADFSEFLKRAAGRIRETDYLLNRGISYETAERLGVGFDPAWKISSRKDDPKISQTPRIIFPWDNGYGARMAGPENGSWKYLKDQTSGVFNSQALQRGIGPVFVVEGETDALSVEEAGFSCVAIGGTGSSALVKKATEVHPDALIICLDTDEAGEKGAATLIEELKKVGVPAFRGEISGDCKDPNSALIKDRARFIQDVKHAHSVLAREWVQERSNAAFLAEFVDGLDPDAATRPIPTGFTQLDQVLDGGLREGLYGVGAISSLGKTTFICQIADQAAQRGEDVFIFSLEMSRLELMSKSLSRHTALIEEGKGPAKDLRRAKTAIGITDAHRYARYSAAEIELIEAACEAYNEYAHRVFVVEGIGNIGVKDVRDLVDRHIKLTRRRPIVVIDYLQILAPADPHYTDKQNTDKAVLELKRMSRDYKIPVIAISSFNRENYSAPVSMAAFKESGAIEYSTDVLFGLQLEGAGSKGFDVDSAKMENPRRIELKILKNRRGQTGGTCFFSYYPMFNLFRERVAV